MNEFKPTNRRPRVLQCITRVGIGGAERVALSIVRGLQAEFDFAVFAVYGVGRDGIGEAMRDELTAMNLPVFGGRPWPMKAGGMVPGGFALARAIRAFRPDVLHFHTETPEACGAAMYALSPKTRQIPAVRTIHSSVFWRFWPRVGRWCDRQLATARVTCVSAAAGDEFLRYRAVSGVAAETQAPRVIYTGLTQAVQPPREGPRTPGRRRILFAGRFDREKGAAVLARAVPLVTLPPNTTAELTFIGRGDDETELRSLATNPPPGWSVTLAAPVPTLEPLFAQFDAAVVPSYFEGLGLVSVEATIAGLPVVTSDAPGLQETLPDDYPWRARPGDPASLAGVLSAALQETDRWQDAVRSAQAFVRQRFDPSAMARAYAETYRSVIVD